MHSCMTRNRGQGRGLWNLRDTFPASSLPFPNSVLNNALSHLFVLHRFKLCPPCWGIKLSLCRSPRQLSRLQEKISSWFFLTTIECMVLACSPKYKDLQKWIYFGSVFMQFICVAQKLIHFTTSELYNRELWDLRVKITLVYVSYSKTWQLKISIRTGC